MANSHFNHSVVNSRQCNEEEIDRQAQYQPNQHLSQPINATMYRSTKGASKARRDQINAEIRNLKEMLPITDADKARLSYLHIMSLACMYTRKSLFFSQGALDDDSNGFMSFHELSELTHELSGFLLLITGDGKLLYLSDNVADHLGHCMVDLVAQSDSVFDIIDPSDHFIMRSNLVPLGTPETDRLFRCRFSTSKLIRRQGAENKLMLVRARCLNPPFPVSTYWTSNPVWVCFCTPLKAKTSNLTLPRSPLLTPPPDRSFLLACFHSQHHKDMRLWDVQDSVSVYLGYDVETLRSRSWYSLLHPRDLSHASAQHCALVSEEGERQVEMVVQVEAKDHYWVWLYMVLQLDNGEYPISCRNYIISESEAWSIRQQLCLEQNQFPEYFGSGETMSSPDQVFTPSSSGLSAQSFDFSAATPGMSSSSEVMPPAGHGPLSSLSSLEEENFSQTHGGQQRWKPPTSHLSFRPSVSSPPTLTEPGSDTLTQSISSLLANQSEPLHTTLTKPLPTLKMPQTEQMGEFGCNPPDTPHYASGCFRFGEKLQFNLDPTNAAEPCQKPQSMALRTPFLSCGHPGLLLPAEPFRKLPPTTEIFGGDECDIMTLPVIRGPLYVDMPQRPFHCPLNGLLTSEASPTQQPCSTFPSVEKEQEREREEISLLAGYIRSLAERFYCDPLLSRETLSSLSSSPTPQSLPQSFPCGVECYSWRGLDPPITQEDISLYEESVILEILIQDLSSFPSSPSLCSSSNSPSHSSSPCSPLTPESYSPPSHFDGKSSIGVHHFCSVQSAQCNCRAVGAGTIRDREVSPESVMDMDVSLMPPSTTFTDSQEPTLSPCALSHPAPTLGLPHAQFLVEELADMVSEFEADASITPSWGNNLSCINSHSTMHSRSFHQGESLRDPTF